MKMEDMILNVTYEWCSLYCTLIKDIESDIIDDGFCDGNCSGCINNVDMTKISSEQYLKEKDK